MLLVITGIPGGGDKAVPFFSFFFFECLYVHVKVAPPLRLPSCSRAMEMPPPCFRSCNWLGNQKGGFAFQKNPSLLL